MFSQKYHNISQDERKTSLDINKSGSHSKSCNGSKIHQEYEYFQLFDPDDSDIEDEADGEHMAQIYSKDTFRENIQKDGAIESYVNLKNQQVKQNEFIFSEVL